jgi:hypothetical protein
VSDLCEGGDRREAVGSGVGFARRPPARKLFSPVPSHAVGVGDARSAEEVQSAAEGQIETPAAQTFDDIEIANVFCSAGLGAGQGRAAADDISAVDRKFATIICEIRQNRFADRHFRDGLPAVDGDNLSLIVAPAAQIDHEPLGADCARQGGETIRAEPTLRKQPTRHDHLLGARVQPEFLILIGQAAPEAQAARPGREGGRCMGRNSVIAGSVR